MASWTKNLVCYCYRKWTTDKQTLYTRLQSRRKLSFWVALFIGGKQLHWMNIHIHYATAYPAVPSSKIMSKSSATCGKYWLCNRSLVKLKSEGESTWRKMWCSSSNQGGIRIICPWSFPIYLFSYWIAMWNAIQMPAYVRDVTICRHYVCRLLLAVVLKIKNIHLVPCTTYYGYLTLCCNTRLTNESSFCVVSSVWRKLWGNS